MPDDEKRVELISNRALRLLGMHIAGFVPMAALLGAFGYWIISSVNRGDATAASVTSLQLEMRAQFAEVNRKLENFPAFVVRLTDLERRTDQLEIAKRR